MKRFVLNKKKYIYENMNEKLAWYGLALAEIKRDVDGNTPTMRRLFVAQSSAAFSFICYGLHHLINDYDAANPIKIHASLLI